MAKSETELADGKVLGNVVQLKGGAADMAARPLKAEDPKLVRERIKQLKVVIDEAYFDLARELYKVWDGNLYLAWGYSKWPDYVEQELGFSVRKAQYFIAMWDYFGVKLADANVIEKVRPLGWAKAKEMVGVVSKENVEEWADKAKSMTKDEFVDEVRNTLREKKAAEDREAAGLTGDVDAAEAPPAKVEKLSRLTFPLFEGQLQTVEAALDRAQDMADSDKRGHLLDLICTDFLSTNEAMKNGAGKGEHVAAIMKKYEKLLGVKIIVIDPEKKSIVFGADAAGFLDELDGGEGFDEAVG